ncbi:MAG: D-alanyl-D-alanine carboxypeptidase [Ruminococcaceae bacterium]|nr:D-alanyl-D-alanine carboxypeptidase [Oscillospiraceae bacterium]
MKRLFCLIICVLFLINTISVSAYNTSAKAAVVIDGYTGEILYSQNCDERLPMASTTKIMSALLMCELGGDLSTKIVTTREMVTVEGSSMGLQVGDTVSYYDLLYGMMLASGNDAANTTAIALGGSVSKFVDMMNERASEMGLVNTHFVTPSGLDADDHYTTAYELAIIAKEALKNEEFLKAASSKSKRLCYGNPPYNRTLTNHNKLLKMYDDVIGVKTGFTKKAGRCLVSAAKKDGKFVIAVTLNDSNDWQDHRELLDLGLSLIESRVFSPPKDETLIRVTSGEKVKVILPSANINVTDNSNVEYKINLPTFLYAPVKSQQQIGSINYYCNGISVCELPIFATGNIEYNHNDFILLFELFKSILLNV